MPTRLAWEGASRTFRPHCWGHQFPPRTLALSLRPPRRDLPSVEPSRGVRSPTRPENTQQTCPGLGLAE